ncbi:MAG: Asp-tRNA(Asn)/Glu-tRNA(Gln) amidotransferase subunit GatB [Planctomycetaceae bacterium]
MYSVIIGLEVHVQLQTQTKIFCGCSTAFNPDQPNVQTCPVCLGLPGSLPVLNERALHLAIKTALALNCQIARFTKWDRKQYFYPDLPKGYQISQYDLPFSHDGWVDVAQEEGKTRRIGIIRAHLEEDAGKNVHDESGRGRDSQVDLNRAGTPLVEIVTQPDLRSSQEARLFLEELRRTLTYLEVSDCNMQEGSLRCDANVNLHVQKDDGSKVATPIVEIKNLNSFRFTEQAIEHEIARQWQEFQKTGRTIKDAPKSTRGYDPDRGATFPMREKEEAADYRYFPDPDLAPVIVDDAWLARIQSEMVELPTAKRQRFQSEYGLSEYDASVIIDQGAELADYFEALARECGDGKQAANWVTQDVLRELKERSLSIGEFAIGTGALASLLRKINAKQITIKSAREVFLDLLSGERESAATAAEIDAIITAKGLAIVQDTGALETAMADVIAKNAKAVADFQAGKQQALGALIGQVMKAVKGADPQTVRELLAKKLSSS